MSPEWLPTSPAKGSRVQEAGWTERILRCEGSETGGNSGKESSVSGRLRAPVHLPGQQREASERVVAAEESHCMVLPRQPT